VLKIDGEITFDLKELGKLYKNTKDITVLAIENLLHKAQVPDGVYLIIEQYTLWKRIVRKHERIVRLYSCEVLELLKEDL
jgi:hypothetical protein